MALYNCPRISFSIDFSDSQQQQPIKLESSYNEAPASSDFDFFEFSVPNDTMISADELFFKGRMLPLRESRPRTTLRDELRLASNTNDGGDGNNDDREEEEEDYAPTSSGNKGLGAGGGNG